MLKTNSSLPNAFVKSKVSIYKVGETIDLTKDTDLDADTGFYSALEDGDFVNIKTYRIEFSITRIGSVGDSGKYIVSKTSGLDALNITLITSSTYEDNGYFMDDDTATINNISIFFGGVGEGSSSTSAADPYIFPYYGRPTKLPDCSAIYKMCEGNSLHINSIVDKLSKNKIEYLYNWTNKQYGIDSKKHNLISWNQ